MKLSPGRRVLHWVGYCGLFVVVFLVIGLVVGFIGARVLGSLAWQDAMGTPFAAVRFFFEAVVSAGLVWLTTRPRRQDSDRATVGPTAGMTPVTIATFGPTTAWVGKRITREGDGFILEDHGPISPADVMAYHSQGQLVWANDGTRAWVGSLAHRQTATKQSAPGSAHPGPASSPVAQSPASAGPGASHTSSPAGAAPLKRMWAALSASSGRKRTRLIVVVIAAALAAVVLGMVFLPRLMSGSGAQTAQSNAQPAPSIPPTSQPSVLTPGNPTVLADDAGKYGTVSVSGTMVAWTFAADKKNYHVYTYDLATGARDMLSLGGSQTQAAIADGAVVWSDGQNPLVDGASRILLRERPSAAPVTISRGYWVADPAIGDRYVAWAENARGDSWDVYAYDLSEGQETAVCTDAGDQWGPAVVGDFVVWQDLGSDKGDVYAKNLLTGEVLPIAVRSGWQGDPDTDGELVVWGDRRSGEDDIYSFDLSTAREAVVSAAPDNQFNPCVSGSMVAWADWRNGSTADIYCKNLATGAEHLVAATGNSKNALDVDISGDVVVWVDGQSVKAMRLPQEWVPSSSVASAGDGGSPQPLPSVNTLPPLPSSDAVAWADALGHVGEVITVEGPVVTTFYDDAVNGQPTFLNVGGDYTDSSRFVVVIWGEDRSAFPSPPESMYEGKQIRVTGEVTEYEGHAQIAVSSPDAIQVIE